ncbi:MAG TPA: EcsC family protein [Verrucomicrobiae bacterium]|jgi:hypothetical protein
MEKPPIICPLSDAETRDLRLAKSLLESAPLGIRLANTLGSPLEKGFAMLPKGWNNMVNKATHAALFKALTVALATLGRKRQRPSREFFHKVLAGTSGGIGGAFGLAALPVELPVSTTLILRSIADIARSEGHDLSQMETRLACIEVFALGGTGSESTYWMTRAAMSQAMADATAYLAQKGVIRESAPAIARMVSAIAARFGVVVSEEVAAKAVPIIGAAGGSIVNVMFMSHFQELARGHFIVKRLEAARGMEQVRTAYNSLQGAKC